MSPLTADQEAYYVQLLRRVRELGVSWNCINRTIDAIQAEDTLGALRKLMARSRRPADRRAYQHAIDVQLGEEKAVGNTKVYVTPECATAVYDPELHKQCKFPGYDHPVLKRVKVECGCACHVPDGGSEGRSS